LSVEYGLLHKRGWFESVYLCKRAPRAPGFVVSPTSQLEILHSSSHAKGPALYEELRIGFGIVSHQPLKVADELP
jgi:hypothetical protein